MEVQYATSGQDHVAGGGPRTKRGDIYRLLGLVSARFRPIDIDIDTDIDTGCGAGDAAG